MQYITEDPVNTHYGPTGSSCTDYIMLPEYLLELVESCVVHETNPLNTSDHNQISMILCINWIQCRK